MRKKTIKYLYIIFGWLSLLLGIIGIFLPLLPTTPFLLITAFCFSRSSEKFHKWLLHHKHLGPPIKDWEARGVIRLKVKLLAALMILVTGYFILTKQTIPPIGKISFVLLALFAQAFIWSRPSR